MLMLCRPRTNRAAPARSCPLWVDTRALPRICRCTASSVVCVTGSSFVSGNNLTNSSVRPCSGTNWSSKPGASTHNNPFLSVTVRVKLPLSSVITMFLEPTTVTREPANTSPVALLTTVPLMVVCATQNERLKITTDIVIKSLLFILVLIRLLLYGFKDHSVKSERA